VTKAHSTLNDNGFLCESCNRPETQHQLQTTYPVLLANMGPGGMPAWGTMWLCQKCRKEHEERDAAKARP